MLRPLSRIHSLLRPRGWRVPLICLVAPVLFWSTTAYGQSAAKNPSPTDKPFIVEYYYKVRWGHQKEFWNLFQKNHLPLLRRQLERGDIKELKMDIPYFHQQDAGRWDYRVTVVYPNAAAAVISFTDEEKRQLFPDQQLFTQEEQRRFELLLDHWDLPITNAPLEN